MYQYRETYCPKCQRKFMVQVYPEYDVIISHDGEEMNGWINECTTCKMRLFVRDGVLEGADIDEFPDEEKKYRPILR